MNHVKTEEQVQYQARPKLRRYAIGIDGGVNTGYAVWDRVEREFIEIETLDFWTAYRKILSSYKEEEVEIFVEDPEQISPVFNKKGVNNMKAFTKVSQNVGGVKKESRLFAQGLISAEYTVQLIKPSGAKWTAKQLEQATKWKGRTSQHARDAARLVIGR